MKWFCRHSTCLECKAVFDPIGVEPEFAKWCSRCREPFEARSRRLARLKSWCYANESRLTEQMEKEEKERLESLGKITPPDERWMNAHIAAVQAASGNRPDSYGLASVFGLR